MSKFCFILQKSYTMIMELLDAHGIKANRKRRQQHYTTTKLVVFAPKERRKIYQSIHLVAICPFMWDKFKVTFYIFTGSVDRLLEQGVQSEDISPGPVWRRFTHVGRTAIITYQLRVLCDEYYGNVTCSAYCRPRNDNFGHWYCNEDSQIACLDGWTGQNCEKGTVKLSPTFAYPGYLSTCLSVCLSACLPARSLVCLSTRLVLSPCPHWLPCLLA